PGAFNTQSSDLFVGAETTNNGSSFRANFTGSMDEVRLSNVARSADWIATEYNNQSSPAAFYNEGSPAITSLSPNSGYFGTSVTITGKHLGSSQGSSTVTFGGTPAIVTSL